MYELGLEKVGSSSADPGREDLRANVRVNDCCGCSIFGNRLAPCTQCEWSGLCPEYSDKPDRPAGS